MLKLTHLKTLIIYGVILFAFSIKAETNRDTKNYFKHSKLVSSPSNSPADYIWQTKEGYIIIQGGELSLLTNDSKNWVKLKNKPLRISKHAMTTSYDGKFYIVDGTKTFTLEYVNGGIIRNDLKDLPAPITNGDISVNNHKLYITGLDTEGNNIFYCNGVKQNLWSTQKTKKVLMAQLKGNVYVFADENRSGKLTAYEFNTHKSKWNLIGSSNIAIETTKAFACGDAHILFLSKNTKQIHALYLDQKKWVQFNIASLPEADFSLSSDYKSFTVVTPKATHKFEAIFPKTKYGIWDHLIVGLFFLMMLGVGRYISKREKDSNDFFRGGQRLPSWAVGISMFATGASAVSLMAQPAQAYTDNWLYLSIGLVQFILLPITFFVVIPITRRLQFSSAFEYLEARYCPAMRMFGSLIYAFMQLVTRMATVMLLPSIALSAVCGIPMEVSILIMGTVTTIYCMMGGFEAVVWTDVIQAFVMLLAMIMCVVWIFISLDTSASDAWQLISSENKLQLFDFSWDQTQPIIYIIFFSYALQSIAVPMGDQNFIQRVQAVKSEKEARKAAFIQLGVAIPLNACLFALGTCLYLYYNANPADISPAMKADGIFPLFAAQTLPTGLAGIVVAALMAATMSTLSSALNSVSNIAVEDYVRKFKKDFSDHQAIVWGKGFTVALGIIGTALSLLLAQSNSTSIWDLILMILGVIFAPLSSMYLLGVLTKRVNTAGVIAGCIAGICATLYCKSNFNLHVFFFTPIGLVPSLVVGYLLSWIIPSKPKDLTGLTIFSLPPKPEKS
ncbi:sodium/solute symporter [Lentisphaera marina]|uniref:sodium:solute symporter family transporter n=1 Tax=Lentisphaera marina TaxID=1111041 RepID=UPI0023668D50|nr:sodium/solute symporter [Lentisphaera marina]MDD7985315.1 sodium/solute symporter [Lentisphaera marina]